VSYSNGGRTHREGEITGWSDYVQEERPNTSLVGKEEGDKMKND
jgi:hypothetical protein